MAQKNRPQSEDGYNLSVVPPQFTVASRQTAFKSTPAKAFILRCCNGHSRRSLLAKAFGARLSECIRFETPSVLHHPTSLLAALFKLTCFRS